MKRTLYFFIALLLLSNSSFAQEKTGPLKIGYTNVSYVLSLMKESKEIEKELETYSKQLEKELQRKGAEYQEKLQNYQRGANTMPDAIKADKERELISLQENLQKFQEDAEVSLQKKQAQLLEPITKKISTAIQEVAKEKGYTYIFNSDAGFGTTQILLHAPESDNVTEAVLKKLGVEVPENVKEETNK